MLFYALVIELFMIISIVYIPGLNNLFLLKSIKLEWAVSGVWMYFFFFNFYILILFIIFLKFSVKSTIF